MRSASITQRTDSVPWEENTEHIARWFCCDCGLAHDLEFKVKSKKFILVTATRNEHATAGRRRYNKFKCTPVRKRTKEVK